MEKTINEFKKSDGEVLMLEDPGNNCPMCNSPPTCKEGITWAMGDLSNAYAFGKYGIKKDPKKANKWLLEAVNANDLQSLYTPSKKCITLALVAIRHMAKLLYQ